MYHYIIALQLTVAIIVIATLIRHSSTAAAHNAAIVTTSWNEHTATFAFIYYNICSTLNRLVDAIFNLLLNNNNNHNFVLFCY